MIILNSNIKEFVDQFGLSHLADSKKYETFSNYCIASKFIKNITITNEILDDISTGEGGDWGIDGIIVLINGRIVSTVEQANEMVSATTELRVKIILTQSKTSVSIDSGGLAKTLNGAENLIRYAIGENHPYPEANEGIKQYREILKLIYENAFKFPAYGLPSLNVFFSYKGTYQSASDIVTYIESTRKEFDSKECLSNFQCEILDKNSIIDLYKNAQRKNTEELNVMYKISLPEVRDIDSSYLCLIPFSEFRKLIVDESNQIREEVFYDNVRAFQGDNAVNRSIAETLQNGEIALFTALNNGITIVAREVSTVMNKITLSDFQIVNGCQTCNVIFNNIDTEGINNLQLLVKIIASDNKEIRDRVIVANNSQTAVVREQLLALLEELRRIEDYYNAQRNYDTLYYERRSKQYHNDTQIKKWQIVTTSMQITSFIGMILGKPGKIRGYYGHLLENFNETSGFKVFDSKYHPALYFLSAYACVKMTQLFQSAILPKDFKTMKFFVLYAFRKLTEKGNLKSLTDNDKNIEEYCEHICKILYDDEKCKKGFLGAVDLIRNQVLRRNPTDNDRFNQDLVSKIDQVINRLDRINEHKK